MTFIDYSVYINSEAWKRKRAEFLSTCPKSRRCGICKIPYEKGFHVHHLTYERLGKERFSDLLAVCPGCHEEIHLLHDRRRARAKRKNKKWPSIRSTTKRLQRKVEKVMAKQRAKQRSAQRLNQNTKPTAKMAAYYGIPLR